MRRLHWIILGGIMVLIFSTILLLGFIAPDTYKRTIIAIDVFGITQEASQENGRINQIMNLQIPYEQKQALINHTVFMGASMEMVKLSLGDARNEKAETTTDGRSVILWHYHLAGDSRPTVFEFENSVMVKAYRGSAIDAQ